MALIRVYTKAKSIARQNRRLLIYAFLIAAGRLDYSTDARGLLAFGLP